MSARSPMSRVPRGLMLLALLVSALTACSAPESSDNGDRTSGGVCSEPSTEPGDAGSPYDAGGEADTGSSADAGTDAGTTPCPPGTDGCGCYGNGTCNVDLVCNGGVCVPELGFVLIPAGSFVQGPNPYVGDNISRTVTISRPFYMQNTEVTQRQWESLMGNNPSSFSGCADCPVEAVSWWDAVAYMNAASARAGLESCYTLSGCTGTAGSNLSCTGVTFSGLSCFGYRLPTEAEWEYAARAGTTGNYYGELDAISWYSSNSGSRTQPVGGKLPNAFGLYDMLGNVWEWNWDWYAAYTSANVTDPLGPNTGSYRVVRGGGWYGGAEYLVVSGRRGNVPGFRFDDLGFRPSRSVP